MGHRHLRLYNSRPDRRMENGFAPLPAGHDALSRYLKEVG